MRISLLIKLEIKCFSISCFHFQKQNPNHIVGPHPPNPPPPNLHLIKGGGEGVGPSKNWITWGEWIFLRERRDKLEKGGIYVKMGGCHFFYYFTVQFNHIYFFGSSVFWVSHARISFMFSSKSCTKT